MQKILGEEILPNSLRQKYVNIQTFMNLQEGSVLIPTDFLDDLRNIVKYISGVYGHNHPNYDRIQELKKKLESPIVPWDEVAPLLLENNQRHRITYEDYSATNRKLENRIKLLEQEITRLGTNPALDNKLDKLGDKLTEIKGLEDKLTNTSLLTLSSKILKLENEVHALSIGSEIEEPTVEHKMHDYEISEKRVFVIMPFAPKFTDVWRGAIEKACNSLHYYCLRVDEVDLSSGITNDIRKCVGLADVVIADITESNPNVMFELGWALAKEREAIIIRQNDDPTKIAFDVQEYRYIPYLNTWSGIEQLRKDLCKFISGTEKMIEKKKAENKSSSETKKEKP